MSGFLKVLDVGLHGTRVFLEGASVLRHITADGNTLGKKGDMGIGIGVLTLQLMYAMIPNKKPEHHELAQKVKNLESLLRIIHVPFKMCVAVENEEEGKLEEAGAEFIGSIRNGAEASMAEENKYISMSEEERASATRPVYAYNAEGMPCKIGEKAVDLDECQENLKQAKAVATVTNTIEVALRMGLIKKSYNVYRRVADFFNPPAEGQRPVAAAAVAAAAEEPANIFDLRSRQTVPAELYNDPVLSRNTCPITGLPIRDPVRVKAHPEHIFERAFIYQWIEQSHNNPLTREPLELSDLEDCKDIKLLIDNRLAAIEQRLLQTLQTMQKEERRS